MAARAGGQGGKQPTINDVAALAGVSKKTVSRVINRSEFISEKTRKSVQQAIETLGFVPNPQARALAFRRNFLIALLHDNPNAQTVLWAMLTRVEPASLAKVLLLTGIVVSVVGLKVFS